MRNLILSNKLVAKLYDRQYMKVVKRIQKAKNATRIGDYDTIDEARDRRYVNKKVESLAKWGCRILYAERGFHKAIQKSTAVYGWKTKSNYLNKKERSKEAREVAIKNRVIFNNAVECIYADGDRKRGSVSDASLLNLRGVLRYDNLIENIDDIARESKNLDGLIPRDKTLIKARMSSRI